MENNSKKQASKRTFNFSGLLAVILAVLLLAIVIPINLIVQYFDFKIDTTPSKMYTLTDKSIELLDSVKDKQIEMYVLAPGVDDIEDFAEDDMALSLYYALKQYDEYDNIKITCFDPEERPELVEKLNSGSLYKLSSGTIFVKCGDFTHKITGIWNEITDSDGNVIESKYLGEDLIAGAIKTVTAGDIANIYFLTGHGEKTIDNYNFFKSETKNRNYDLLELNLSAEDAVPDDARIIFICAPQKDITLNEQEKLMDYLEKGGNISFFLSPNDEEFRYKNIEAILDEYNIVMHYDRIYETNSHLCASDDPTMIQVTLPEVSKDQTVDLTSAFSDPSVIPYMPNSRSFGLINGKNTSVLETNSLMQTTSTSSGYSSCSEPFGGTEKDTEAESGCFDLAFYSYNKSNNSKITVFGNADFFNDENLSSAYTIIPYYLSLSAVSWMYDSDYSLNIPDKNRSYDSMEFKSQEEADNTLKIFTVAPILVALIGVIIWWRRHNA